MTNNKRLQVWLPLLFSITLIAGMFIGYKMRDGIPGKSFFYAEKRRPIQEVMDIIEKKYVDDVNFNSIADSGIQAMLLQLDPHSAFIPASDVDKINEDINGSFFGIGIEFNVIHDTMHVVNVMKDGPSAEAGLQTGDRILKAGDSAISGMKIDQERVRRLLRGPLGSKVDLTILRGNQQKIFPVKRGVIPLVSLDAAYMIDKSTGYIRLSRFSTKTYREFMNGLMELKKQGLKELILDLRGNGGGILDDAVEIADEFLSDDKIITYTEGKHVGKKEYRCRRKGQFEEGPLVILADEGTASASEILMGALQDWDRATIVGRRTFGKGLVQEQYTLSDNSALRLTIARYFTPVGRSIQRPYKAGGKAAYLNDIYNRYTDGEMVSADSVKNDTTKIFKTMVAHKRVFGGGGISPDYFVPADTTRMSLVTAKLLSKGVFNDYGYRFFLENPGILQTYKTPRNFVKLFNLSPEGWKLFEDMAAADSISLTGIPEKEKATLITSLKMAVASQLFRKEGYFEMMNADDPNVKKALEIIKN